jgi:uncharacterized protein YdiU (UPF0061 family)
MDQKQVLKQMLEMNKATFDNTFIAINQTQDQIENMTNILISQATWLPKEGKKAINDWAKAYKEGRDTFKKSMDENFEKVLGFFNEAK